MFSHYKHILIENRGKLRIIKFNNPRKRNALNRIAFAEITNALNTAANDESVAIVAFTGVGDFYTSGNDLTIPETTGDFDDETEKAKMILMLLIKAFYEFPKLLFAVVNGPCIGIGATTAALCDVIYCTDTAYFYTPFTQLGLCPEGCSTYTFPRILGKSKATEMILLNHKMSAEEALKYNFVSAVYKTNELETKVWPKIESFTNLPKETVFVSKRLMQKFEKDKLDKVVSLECNELQQRWYSEEFSNAILQFLTKKAKL